MKARYASNYNPEFPEQFTWGHVDSPKMSSLSSIISTHILHDLKTHDRLLVPGLRQALNYVAELTDI